MRDPEPISYVNVRTAKGTFLIRTASKSWYVIQTTASFYGTITVSGGSSNRPAETALLDGYEIVDDNIMSFSEGYKGHSTPVKHIFNVSGMTDREIEEIKSSFEERHAPRTR